MNRPTSNQIPFLFFAVALWALSSTAFGGMKSSKLHEIDQAIAQAIASKQLPGAVIWVESKGQVYKKAYGKRAKTPQTETMTVDTIFDIASLTKVISTAPSILHLAEKKALNLDDPVHTHLPDFLKGGFHPKATDPDLSPADRESITIRQLLTHQSGLPASISLMTREFFGHEEGVFRATTIGIQDKPGELFRYSDVNYILLGEIVRQVSGMRLDEYARKYLFEPLRMDETQYQLPESLIPRAAPTTVVEGYGPIRGEVHDPTCRRMQGVAGHAGLFSTAEDIAKFCRMYIPKQSKRVPLSKATITDSTRSHTAKNLRAPRGLGWDIGSRFAYQRGENFPTSGFGHTGWTGTSIWIDPKSETFVILLSNRNHPDESGNIKKLRYKVGTLAAQAVGYWQKTPNLVDYSQDEPTSDSQTAGGDPNFPVYNGIDLLEQAEFKMLKGLRVGLITNHTGINRNRRTTIDLLAESPNVNLIKLFSPEHGIRGKADGGVDVADGRDTRTGLPIHSLYKSANRKPSTDQLSDIDALVFDIQDIGCRFYTYISTMGLAMEAAHDHGKTFIVLDRVNPIGGKVFDGPIREGKGNDFVAYHDIPIVHGMTVGELAMMFKAERDMGKLDLKVVPLDGWRRDMLYDQTRLPWLNPSPNIRSLTQALLYPGIGLLEFSNLSVGRGTRTPFEVVGAPWITEGRLAARLKSERLPGIQFIPIRFTPSASVYSNEDCGGVRLIVTDREKMNPIDVGLAIGRAIQADYPKTFNLVKPEKGNILLRQPQTHQDWIAGQSTKAIRKTWDKPLKQFKKRRQEFLIYKK